MIYDDKNLFVGTYAKNWIQCSLLVIAVKNIENA